jgi:hypothetical protein
MEWLFFTLLTIVGGILVGLIVWTMRLAADDKKKPRT